MSAPRRRRPSHHAVAEIHGSGRAERIRAARLEDPKPSVASDEHEVFVAYAQVDREIVSQLVEQLLQSGVRVKWDQDFIVGDDLNIAIRTAIATAKAVIVVWSDASVQSPYVYDEAKIAAGMRKLITTHVADFDPDVDTPVGFGRFITIPLDQFGRILRSLEAYGVVSGN